MARWVISIVLAWTSMLGSAGPLLAQASPAASEKRTSEPSVLVASLVGVLCVAVILLVVWLPDRRSSGKD